LVASGGVSFSGTAYRGNGQAAVFGSFTYSGDFREGIPAVYSYSIWKESRPAQFFLFGGTGGGGAGGNGQKGQKEQNIAGAIPSFAATNKSLDAVYWSIQTGRSADPGTSRTTPGNKFDLRNAAHEVFVGTAPFTASDQLHKMHRMEAFASRAPNSSSLWNEFRFELRDQLEDQFFEN
jgi:hypothetical protein